MTFRGLISFMAIVFHLKNKIKIDVVVVYMVDVLLMHPHEIDD
jgi:hypothetical protein